MFTESAEIYDLVYSFKDYKKESDQIKTAIDARQPGAKSLLDVACGTGEHHKYLKDQFSIDGIDLNQKFIEIARRKNTLGSYSLADMTELNLNKRYDVITCLFSSIGYLKTYTSLVAALSCFHRHLNDDGLLMVEPWFSPENWVVPKIHLLTYEKDDIKICRMNMSESENEFSIVKFHYLLGTLSDGVKHFEERHELKLFTKEEMIAAFVEAGFDVEHHEEGLVGRGMYYGVKK